MKIKDLLNSIDGPENYIYIVHYMGRTALLNYGQILDNDFMEQPFKTFDIIRFNRKYYLIIEV